MKPDEDDENDWLKGLDEPVAHQAELVARAEDVAAAAETEFRDIQTNLYQRASEVVEDALLFNEIDPDADGPPDHWVEKYGQERAVKAFRVARSAWLSGKESPIGLQIALRQVLGIMKAKATEQAAPRTLSVTLVQGGAMPVFPEKIVEDGKKGY